MPITPRSVALLLLGAVATAVAVHFLPLMLGVGVTGVETGDLASGGALSKYAMSFAGGLLTALTPCVYPLIPITVSVFGARQAGSTLRRFALVSVYVLGIAITFSSLGLFAALSGKAFGTFLANRWVLVGLFVFFAVMASSMFGAFDLALPEPIMARLNRVGGTGFGGAFGMGLVAGLIAAPCTGPVLTSLLTFVATSGQPVFGVSLLFVHALGIGVPFFLIGAFSFSLPRSGAWMEGVKSVFGVALLVLGFGYLRDAFPTVKAQLQPLAQVVAFAGVAAGVGVLLGAVHASFHGDVLEKLRKAAGVAIVVFAITARMTFSHAEGGTQVVWVVDHDAALAQAKLDGRPAMIDFTAEWCAACKELEKFTYTDPLVAAESARFVNVKIDSTIEDDRVLALQQKYGVKGLPTVVFVDAQGVLLQKPRVTGFVEGPEYLELMQQVK